MQTTALRSLTGTWGASLSKRDFREALRDLDFELVDDVRKAHVPASTQQDQARDEDAGNAGPVQGEDLLVAREDNEQYPRKTPDEFFSRRREEFEARMARAANGSALSAMAASTTEEQSAATKLQSRFRGFRTRRASVDGSLATAPAVNIVSSERALRTQIALARHRDASFNLRSFFVKYDKSRLGLLSLPKFSLALESAGIQLSHAHLRDLGTYFENEEDKARRIDYNSFLAFAGRENSHLGVIADHLRSALLRYDKRDAFDAFDKDGNGVIDRREFRKGLVSLGLRLEDGDVSLLMDIFDHDGLGEIDYRSFERFLTSHPVARDLRVLEGKLRSLFDKAAARGVALQSSFSEVDSDGDGSITKGEFRSALRRLRFDLSTGEVDIIFSRFDPDDKGCISYSEFISFVSASKDTSTALEDGAVDFVNLKKRASNVVRLASDRGSDILEYFEHYDWKGSRNMRENEFRAALKRAGFFFTVSEIDALCKKFKSERKGRRVDYRKFVDWASPAGAGLERT